MDIEVPSPGDNDEVKLTLSRPQLYLLAGAVNEAIEAVDEWEFSTRLGASKADARQLRTDLRLAIAKLESIESDN